MSEAEGRSSGSRSPYGMRISARVGRAFTLASERSGPGELQPAQLSRQLATDGVAIHRSIALSANDAPAQHEDEILTESGASHAELLEFSEQPSRLPAGVARLKSLLPRGWFAD